jgi:hypothetical protein
LRTSRESSARVRARRPGKRQQSFHRTSSLSGDTPTGIVEELAQQAQNKALYLLHTVRRIQSFHIAEYGSLAVMAGFAGYNCVAALLERNRQDKIDYVGRSNEFIATRIRQELGSRVRQELGERMLRRVAWGGARSSAKLTDNLSRTRTCRRPATSEMARREAWFGPLLQLEQGAELSE